LEDKRIATFTAPIEYAEGHKDIVDIENKECGIGIVPIFVGCETLYFTAFAMCTSDAADGYYLLVGNHSVV
jgi:hypothetical protein